MKMVYATKKGKMKDPLQMKLKKTITSMSMKDAKKYASTKHENYLKR